MKLKICVILGLLLTLSLSAYDRLTREEAEAWVYSVDKETVLDYIIAWDFTKHAVPEVELPEYVLIFDDKGNVFLIPNPPKVPMVIGDLLYDLSFPEMIYEKVASKRKCSWIVPLSVGTVVGLLIGIVTTSLVSNR